VLSDPEAKIYEGDCREVLGTLPGASIDLAVTDPPYNVGWEYGTGYDDAKPVEEFLAMLRKSLSEVHRVLKPCGSAFLFMGANLQAETLLLLKQIGFHHRGTIIWHYTFGPAQQGNFTPSWVPIHYVTKSPTNFVFNADAVRVPSARQLKYRDKRANAKGKLPDNVWALLPEHEPALFRPESDAWLFSRVCGTFKERTAHSNQLPLALAERIIKVASNPGDVVLDPFLGSGTVLVAARQLGRAGIGIELSSKTVDLAWDRLQGVAARTTLTAFHKLSPAKEKSVMSITSSDEAKVYKPKRIYGGFVISTDQGDKCIILRNQEVGLKDEQNVVADGVPKECDVRIVLEIDKDMKLHMTVHIEGMTLTEDMALGDFLKKMVEAERFSQVGKVVSSLFSHRITGSFYPLGQLD